MIFMKERILDTNFMITCTKQKIDFFKYFYEEGYSVIIPNIVITELEKIATIGGSNNSTLASLSIRIMGKNNFKIINIKGKTVDKAIINYANNNQSITIATLDREMQRKVKNKKFIIRGKNQLELI